MRNSGSRKWKLAKTIEDFSNHNHPRCWEQHVEPFCRRHRCKRYTPRDSAPRRKYMDYYDGFVNVSNSTLANISGSDPERNIHRQHRANMGALSPSKGLVSSLKSVNFSHIFLYLLFLSSANPVFSRRCDIDKCGNHYRSISDKDDPVKRCRLLSLHSECLVKMNMACRGNLLYHTSVHISEKELARWNCSHSSNSVHSSHGNSRTNQCVYAGKPDFKICSLFGDPHVRTFSDKFHTCKANGSWKLVNNDYLMVKAINTQLPGQLRATAVTKLAVVIKNSGECAKRRVYRAEIGQELPESFEDESSHTGINKSVNITVNDPGKEVQIDIRFIATTIVIRHVGSHLAFSIQMPGEMVDPFDEREQMCVRGCPRRQRIPLSKEIKRLTTDGPDEERVPQVTKYSEHEARIKCKEALLRNDQKNDAPPVRTKRSAGKKSRRSRTKKDVGLSASERSWKLLFDSQSDVSKPRSRKGRSRERKRKGFDLEFVHDDPGVGRHRNREKAAVASVSRGTNFYFDACVFDLMTTGDVAYASSARGAFDDVTRFHRSGSKAKGASKKVIVNWTVKDPTSTPPGTSKSTGEVKAATTHRSETTSGASDVKFHVIFTIFCVLYSSCVINGNFLKSLMDLYSIFFNCRLSAS